MRPINRLNPPAWPTRERSQIAVVEAENAQLREELKQCYIALVSQEREIDELKRRAIR